MAETRINKKGETETLDRNGRWYGLGGWYINPIAETPDFVVYEQRDGTLEIIQKGLDDTWYDNSLTIPKDEFILLAGDIVGL